MGTRLLGRHSVVMLMALAVLCPRQGFVWAQWADLAADETAPAGVG